MQSEVILLSNVKQDNIASVVQKQFGMLGITNIKGKRINAEQEAIHKTIAESLADYNVIMIIGGMGEANANMTVSAVAKAIGFNTAEKDGELFPEGAEIFRNKHGKPSGCAIAAGNQCIVMLPGDTENLQFMLCYRVSQYLAEFIGTPFAIKSIRAAGITKAEAEEAVASAETYGTSAAVFEDAGEIAVQIYAKGENRREASTHLTAALKSIASGLGSAAYAVDAENVGQALNKELTNKELKAAIAVEGIQRSEIANAAFTSEYVGNYLGTSQGVEKYDLPEKLLKRHGVNSTWTAAVLAGEVCKAYGSNIGIAVTSDPMKIAEGANIAVCMGDNVWTEHVTAGTREELIAAAGSRAVHLARAVVSAYPKLYENSVSLMSAVSGKSKFRTAEAKTNTKWYSRFVPMKGDSKNEIIRKSVFILCVLVFLGCMGYLSTKVMDSVAHRDLAANLQSLVTNTDIEVPDDWTFNQKLYALYEENKDLIGYIKIDNTNVDFPVVQTERANEKGKKGQYYLRKDYYGSYSMYGTPFLDYRCKTDPDLQSDNLIIYGHNVYDDGKMFSDLIKYRKLSFYKEHPLVHFDTLYGDKDWLVVGVILTNAYEKDGPVWDYNNFIDGDEAELKAFLEQVAKRTMVVTGVEYNTADRFLTLSTCSYDFTDARVVIIAREVREGEDVTAIDTSKAYYNQNPLMPDKWYQAINEAQKSESDATFGEAETIGDANTEENIQEIEIASAPTKTVYKVGEASELDLSGFAIMIKLEDGSRDYVYDGYEVLIAPDFNTPGDYEVQVLYKGEILTFTVTVESNSTSSEVKVESLAVQSNPTKLEYKVGEKFDISGLVIRVQKSDGSTQDITEGFTPSIQNGTELTEGKHTVTVTYNGKTVTFEINVTKQESTSSESSVSTPESSDQESSNPESSDQESSVPEQTAPEQTTPPENPDSGETTPETEENTEGESLSVGGLLTSTRPSSKESPYYKQSLKDTIRINNKTMTVFDAVCQVVAYEAGKGQPEEHVKAQAVATYTYLMYNKNSNLTGVGLDPSKLEARTEKLVKEVIGYAVLDDRSNNFILATYFSESCGVTADSKWVWGGANRNLLSVPSPVDGNKETVKTISSSDFKNKVRNNAGITLSGDPSKWISIYSYFGGTDYVDKVNLGGTLYSARSLRESVLGGSTLRSTCFEVEYNAAKDQFVFTTRGYGHGVGLSAVGSIAYAKMGYEWDEILLKYYSNCYIGLKY